MRNISISKIVFFFISIQMFMNILKLKISTMENNEINKKNNISVSIINDVRLQSYSIGSLQVCN